MVSRIAIIAIVGILAVPILLGYALNVDQVTETDYQTTGDTVNVTPLLQTGTATSMVAADPYSMNNINNTTMSSPDAPVTPIFNKISNVRTSNVYKQTYVPNWGGGGAAITENTKQYEINIDYQISPGNYITARFYENGSISLTVDYIIYFNYNGETKLLTYFAYQGDVVGASLNRITVQMNNLTYIDYVFHGISRCPLIYGYLDTSYPEYVDISQGYYFKKFATVPFTLGGWSVKLPKDTGEAVISIDLGSITDPTYSMKIEKAFQLDKTTTDGNVSWTVTNLQTSETQDLYYNQSLSNNTYQIRFTDTGLYDTISPLSIKYYGKADFRYVGSWQSTIGAANYYTNYQFDYSETSTPTRKLLDDVLLTNVSGSRTPTIRIDAAAYPGFDYPVIEDATYTPGAFKINPSTVINDPTVYGTSISFGGNTYLVKKGNITMSGHDIPVKGLVLSSVPNPLGGYDNKIGNTVISTTAAPSAITFNGKWSASISTTAQEEYQVTKTEWKAGSFAWDGIDQNFIMAGLLASLAAFVGVGIYARRAKTTIWPLLIVCGGAALLFFVML